MQASNANPDGILGALLGLKQDIQEQVPGCIIFLSMPTAWFDTEKLEKII